MNFNSLPYFLFLPAMLLSFLLPKRWKNPALLLASYLFYMGWGAAYALLLLFSTLTTFACGLLVERRALGRRGLWLGAALFLNFGLLFVFKYWNFFAGAAAGIFGAAAPRIDLLLPMGISFFTFQSAGYCIDVWRGTIPAERNFVNYALFVSFFPKLAAGPIDRAGDLLPQLRADRRFSGEDLKAGVLRVFWGLMKKMILADQLAVIVNTVYADPRSFDGGQILAATLCFALQIYCDFSAYSDIAVGSARMLGIRLTENFRYPYGAESLREFWRRWHISLSAWFQDYLYIPLGGSRVPKWRVCLNLMIVFAVSGLWHGAAWTFVLWGLLHGLYRAAGVLLTPLRERLYRLVPRDCLPMRLLRRAGTFLLVTIAWVFFRAGSIPDALYALRACAGFILRPHIPALTALGQSRAGLTVLAVFLTLLWIVDALREKRPLNEWLCGRDLLRYAVICLIIASICIFGYYGNAFDPQAFVYFRF